MEVCNMKYDVFAAKVGPLFALVRVCVAYVNMFMNVIVLELEVPTGRCILSASSSHFTPIFPPFTAIILFSGLGSLEAAQETLSVGVGALAGSTIMLLTVPYGISVLAGRVDIGPDGNTNYRGKPKVSPKGSILEELNTTGVAVTYAIKHGGIIMAITTIPYFLIQIPAMFMHGPSEEVARGEKWWAFSGMVACLVGLFAYMRLQLKISKEGEDKTKRIAIMKKNLQQGKLSLSGALKAEIENMSGQKEGGSSEYQAVQEFDKNEFYPPPKVAAYLKEVLEDAFMSYDENRNGLLDPSEVRMFFRDFHENISEEQTDNLFKKFDTDGDGTISFDEFIGMAFVLITEKGDGRTATSEVAAIIREDAAEGEEEEEMPEDIVNLPPEEQQSAIKKRAFIMLAIGTTLVILFSDPMVDVMQEIAVRSGVSPFYVSFILAPLASNASEVIASQYYAAKKTSKTMTVSLSALEGAAAMNNTFCLSIFMGLIYFRGLAWQYTAETVSIVLVEFFMAMIVQRGDHLTSMQGLLIMAVFPLSLVVVGVLEAFGFD